MTRFSVWSGSMCAPVWQLLVGGRPPCSKKRVPAGRRLLGEGRAALHTARCNHLSDTGMGEVYHLARHGTLITWSVDDLAAALLADPDGTTGPDVATAIDRRIYRGESAGQRG